MRLQTGDRLWVKEELAVVYKVGDPFNCASYYRADLPNGSPPMPHETRGYRGQFGDKYRSRFVDAKKMKREASRYTLVVEAVRIFPCQDITWEEIAAEGGPAYPAQTKGGWWGQSYEVFLPWADNPTIVGVTFNFMAESIDGRAADPVPGAGRAKLEQAILPDTPTTVKADG